MLFHSSKKQRRVGLSARNIETDLCIWVKRYLQSEARFSPIRLFPHLQREYPTMGDNDRKGDMEHWARRGEQVMLDSFRTVDHKEGWRTRDVESVDVEELIARFLYSCEQLGKHYLRLIRCLERKESLGKLKLRRTRRDSRFR